MTARHGSGVFVAEPVDVGHLGIPWSELDAATLAAVAARARVELRGRTDEMR